MLGTKLATYLSQQAVAGNEAKVKRSDGGGVPQPTGAADGDDRDVTLPTARDQDGLQLAAVDAVDDDRGRVGEHRLDVRRGQKRSVNGDPATGVDGVHALGKYVRLRPADRVCHGMELPVRVGDAHVVEVDQRERSDAAAGERLDGPRADATEPDHRDACRLEPLEGGCAEEAGDAAEPVLTISCHGRHPVRIVERLEFRSHGHAS